MQDLETLMVGDVINLNKPKDSAVDIYVDKSRWFTGQLGVYQNNIAIEIQETVYEIHKKNNNNNNNNNNSNNRNMGRGGEGNKNPDQPLGVRP